ncbi:unnamed protein product [Chrysoparadoxa australica]
MWSSSNWLLLLCVAAYSPVFIFCIEEQCQLDCAADHTAAELMALNPTAYDISETQRLVGPTAPPFEAEYPEARAPFPLSAHFCKLGCSYFYALAPTTTACKAKCDATYAIPPSVGLSDWVRKATLECRDGCDIALQRCQPGYFCTGRQDWLAVMTNSLDAMTECPKGTYRDVTYDSVAECIDCPTGTYREQPRGRSLDSCSPCPKGTYQNTTGSFSAADCIRCPDGFFGEFEGMAECRCINEESCMPEWRDFQRESQPFIGRW